MHMLIKCLNANIALLIAIVKSRRDSYSAIYTDSNVSSRKEVTVRSALCKGVWWQALCFACCPVLGYGSRHERV